MLPGREITEERRETIAQIKEKRNPTRLHPFDAFLLSKIVDKEFFKSPFFLKGPFLVYFERHDCPHKDRLFFVEGRALVDFLESRIRPDRGEGLDLTVTTESMEEFLLTNHDGKMFYRKPSSTLEELQV